MEDKRERLLRRLYDVGLWLKALNGCVEVVGGFLTAFLSSGAVLGAIRFLLQFELSEDPHDLIANAILKTAAGLSADPLHFASLYLVAHGAIKILLMAGLLRRRLWAFPAALLFLCVFILFQTLRFTQTQSIALLLFTAFDCVVVLLIWHEYRLARSLTPSASS